MSTLVEFSIVPMDKGDSISPYVARAVAIIKASGLAFQLTPMGTCIEGRWKDVMKVVEQCFEAMQKDCRRIYINIKVDYRRDTSERISAKVKSVLDKLPE